MSAGNIKLNLKEFKHVSSDKNKTILEHKKGHRLELAHGSLSPESRQQLEELAKGNPKLEESRKTPPKAKMADGGETPRWDQMSGPAPADPHQSNDPDYNDKTTSEQDAQRHQQADTEEARGKAMGLYAKGGGIENPAAGLDFNTAKEENEAAYDAGLPCLNPHCKSHGQPHPNCRCYSGGEAYAKGGYVEGHGNYNPSAKEEYFCDMPRHHFKSCEYAHGGEVSQQGNDVKHANREKQRGNSGAAQQQMNYAKSEAKGRAEFERQVKPNMKGLKDGGKPGDAPDMPDDPSAMKDVERDFHQNYIEPDKEESQEQQNQGIDKEVEDATNYIDPQGVGNQQAAPMAPEQQPETPPASSTIQPDQPGNQLEASPTQQPEQQAADQANPSTNPIQRFSDYKQQQHQQYVQEDAAWANDLRNGHIKPETYQSLFANKSTPGKIGTLFGLLLSGAGSGLSHQPNAVLAMMNQTIENDLKAQQQSKQNAENYLRLGQQHQMTQSQAGNLDAETQTKAFALAKANMNWSGLQTLTDNVKKMPPGPQRQQAEAMLGMMNQAVQNENYNILDRAATASAYYKMLGVGPGQGGGNGQSEAAFQQQQRNRTLLGPDGKAMADMAIDRHIPNLPPNVSGQASYPVPQGIRDQVHAQNVLDNKGKDLLSFVKQHSGTWNPQTIAQAKQKVEEMKNFYNGSISGGALTQGRLKWYDEQFKENPTSIVNQLVHGSTKRLEEVVNSNAMRRDQQLKDLGFTVKQPQQAQAPQTSKSGRPMEQRNGKWYYK